MSFTIADGVVALVIVISAFLAYSRGVTREVLAIGGWVAAGFAGFYFAPMVAPLILEIPYVSDILRSSCTLTMLASFAAVFAVALILLAIFTPVLSEAVQNTFLGPVDRAGGFLFGIARGVVLIGVLYLLYDVLVTPSERLEIIDASASHAFISDAAEIIRARAPTEMPSWLQTRIDALMGDCGGPAGGSSAAATFGPRAT